MQLLHQSLHSLILIALQGSHFTDGETILREVKPHGPADIAGQSSSKEWCCLLVTSQLHHLKELNATVPFIPNHLCFERDKYQMK